MKIIEPSARIIEYELPKNIYQRIDTCAAVCYQRPAKPTVEEAQEFCGKMLKIKHFATFEMAIIHLVMPHWYIPDNEKYFFITKHSNIQSEYIVTGSIRAFLENAEFGGIIWNFLNDVFPLLFVDDGLSNGEIRFAQPNEIPWQHKHVAARFIINRVVSHELVRHRPCSYLQESQRYCRYEDEVVFIRPEWTYGDMEGSMETKFWEIHMYASEDKYRHLLKRGLKPQQARAVLPNSTKTEVICYASLPEWKHIFSLRDSPAADPEMRRVMGPLHQEFKEKYPEAFE